MAAFDDVDEFGEPEQPTPAKGKPGNATTGLCPIPLCESVKKANGRFCPRHERRCAVMKYQAGQQGEEQAKAFTDKMKSLPIAIDEIQKFGVDNPILDDKTTGKHASPINWVEFNQRHGIRLEVSEGNRLAPFEKEQWILRAINKFGRTREEATDQWDLYTRTPGKEDYFGYKNQLRLWLPKTEFIDTTRTKFIEAACLEGSDKRKNPNAATVDAHRLAVHDKFSKPYGVSHGHQFFAGRASADLGDRAGPAEGQDDSGTGSGVDSQGISPGGKKRVPEEVKVIALEDSDDEKKSLQSAKKGKARKVNVMEDRAKLYSFTADALNTKSGNVSKVIAEAQVLIQSLEGSQTTGRADEVTRDLKVQAAKKLVALAQAWAPGESTTDASQGQEKNGGGVAAVAPEAAPGDKGKAPGGEEKPETKVQAEAAREADPDKSGAAASAQAPTRQETLEARLEEAKHFHGIAHPHHCRTYEIIIAAADKALEVEETGELDKKKVVIRRMLTCVDQFYTSLKAATAAMNTYKKKRESERDRELAKERVKREREANQKEREDLGKRAKTLAQQKKTVVFPAFYLVSTAEGASDGAAELFGKIDNNDLGGNRELPHDFDVGAPCVIGATDGSALSRAIETMMTHKTMQQVLSSWGAKYKKMTGFEKDDKVSQTLAAKQGKEIVEEFFASLTKQLKCVMDLKGIADTFNSTSWLWGYGDSFYSAGVSPNSGAIFRLVVAGELRVWAAPMAKLVDALKQMGETPRGMDDLSKKVQDMDANRLEILKEKGCTFSCACLGKGALYYIPVGWFVMEKASCSSCPLLYGARKSYFLKSAAGLPNYTAAKDMLAASGLAVQKMDQVVELWGK